MRCFWVIIFVFNFTIICFSNDSTNFKQRKYSLEFGINSNFFLSTRVDNNFRNEWIFWPLISSVGASYHPNKDNKLFFLANWYLNNHLGQNNSVNVFGEVLSITYYQGIIGYKRLFFQKKRFQLNTITSLNWRYGEEFIFQYSYFGEPNLLSSEYNSFGIGLGHGITYRLSKRSFIDLDICYNHFFEKSTISKTAFPDYRPVRNLLIGNFKFGIFLISTFLLNKKS